ncbi:hypothetical protein L1887_59068 [Cichorium endivia]|nr:hypothetical protein L1887_59068 [Cichorium endivia]
MSSASRPKWQTRPAAPSLAFFDLIRSAKLDAGKRRQLEEVDASAAIAAPPERAHEDAEGEMSDQQAMDELLKLLPDALKAEMQPEGSASTAQLTPEQLDAIMASVRSSQASSSASSDVSIEAVAEGGVGGGWDDWRDDAYGGARSWRCGSSRTRGHG